MSTEREISIAIRNAKAQGYQELRVDLKTGKITPLKRGPGIRRQKKHVVITKVVEPRNRGAA